MVFDDPSLAVQQPFSEETDGDSKRQQTTAKPGLGLNTGAIVSVFRVFMTLWSLCLFHLLLAAGDRGGGVPFSICSDFTGECVSHIL